MIIQLGDLEFDLIPRYESGQALTPGEAFALNGLRAERIRAVLAREAEKLGELSGIKVLRLRQRAEELGREFEFVPPARPRKRVSTELEQLVLEIAEEKAREIGGDVAQFATSPKVYDQARTILEARRVAARHELEEL